MKTKGERRAILENEITKRLAFGWKISSRTDTYCLLERDKKADSRHAINLLGLFLIPGILYLLFHKWNKTLVVEVNEEGEVKYGNPYYSARQLEEFKK